MKKEDREKDNSSGSLSLDPSLSMNGWAMVSLHSACQSTFTNIYGSDLNKCLQTPKHMKLQMFMQNKDYNRELKLPILKQQ